MDGLGARLSLADLAEKSIDAQYFLMKADSAGLLFVLKLTEAADRGVRVRLLLDDIFTSVDDQILAVLSRHPNIELRLFNPVGRGGSYYANYLADFKQANRRMHNKSLTVDNQISVVGGRNIADEYFELLAGKEFKDFDMLALGPVAAEIASTFDLFWNHKLAIPIEAFQEDRETESLQHVRARMGSSESAESETLSQPIAQRRFEHSVD
jgi:putative cardiolipin synthase